MKIDILHTNDIHSNIQNLAKAGAIINRIRKSNFNTLLVDSGDMITGDFQFKFNQGNAEVEINNYLNYDIVTVGNHDFDYGLDFLKSHMSKLNCDYVLSNIIDGQNLIGEFKPYIIKEINGLKVGFISFLLPYIEVVLKDYPQFEYLHQTNFQTIIDQVKAAGADIVIALNHQGIERDIRLANETTGIDVIIGAHSHTELQQPHQVNGTIIVQTGCFGTKLGHIELEITSCQITSFEYQLYDLEVDGDVDQNLQSIIDKHIKVANEQATVAYGSCVHSLEGRREVMIKQSTNLGSLICDSYIDYAKGLGYNPDFAFINARGLRQSIEPGEITYRHLYNVMPFEKTMVVCEVSGADLKIALDNPIELQTSNLRIVNTNGTKQIFDNQNKPLVDEQIYQIATMNYVYDHHMFEQIQNGQLLERDISTDVEIVSSYIKKLGHNFEYQSNNMVETNE